MSSTGLNRILAAIGGGIFFPVALLLALNATTGPVKANPGVLYVHPTCASAPSPCFTTIQGAVDAASSGDEIRIATGVYTDIHQRNTITQVVYIAKDLTLLGGWSDDFSARNPKIYPTTIDAQGRGRGVVVSGAEVTLDGLRITGGNASRLGGGLIGYYPVDVGSGVFLEGSSATLLLNDCSVYDNINTTPTGPSVAGVGGGIGVNGGRLLVQGGEVYSNTATEGGGIGILEGTAILTETFVHHNVTTQTGGYIGSGGGIYVGGVLTGTRLVVAGNESAADGGGVAGGETSALALIEAEVYSNDAAYDGGGISQSGGSLVLTDTQVYSNTAGEDGGGLYTEDASLTASGCDVHHNTAQGAYSAGGGLYLNPGAGDPTTIEHCRIHHNRADFSGGLYFMGYRPFTFRWNRVYANTASQGCGGLTDRGSLAYPRDGNLILDNRAGEYGGGLCLGDWITVTWQNTVVAGNGLTGPDGQGAGVYIENGGRVTLRYTTLADNSGGSGLATVEGARASMSNTIVAGHTDGPGIWAATGSTVTMEATLWHGNGSGTGGPGTVVTATPDLRGDPLFAAPEADDYRLTASSPAIDAGVNALVYRDLEQDSRPQGGGYDIGADEYLCHGVTGARILGPEGGWVGVYTFTAVPEPSGALPPFTCTWQPEPDAGQGERVVTYTWLSPGVRSITVTVENCSGVATATHAITLYVPTYGVLLTPVARSAQAAPGETVAYTHTLRNTGDTADTYTVTVGSTQGWAVLRSPGTVDLDAGETAVVTVVVTVPAAAVGGTTDAATVRAASHATPTVYAEATDRTTVAMWQVYLPLVMTTTD